MKVVHLKRTLESDAESVAATGRWHGDSDDCMSLARILSASLDTCEIHERHAIRRMIDLLDICE